MPTATPPPAPAPLQADATLAYGYFRTFIAAHPLTATYTALALGLLLGHLI